MKSWHPGSSGSVKTNRTGLPYQRAKTLLTVGPPSAEADKDGKRGMIRAPESYHSSRTTTPMVGTC